MPIGIPLFDRGVIAAKVAWELCRYAAEVKGELSQLKLLGSYAATRRKLKGSYRS